MAKEYRLTAGQRAANRAFATMTRHGLGAKYRYVLTVRGRKSGLPRSTPVDVMDVDGQRYLVAPYGEVNWVRNLRVAKQLTLSRAGTSESFAAEEVTGDAAAPVIRTYIERVPVTRAYWDVDQHSPVSKVAAQVVNHPVFRLRPVR